MTAAVSSAPAMPQVWPVKFTRVFKDAWDHVPTALTPVAIGLDGYMRPTDRSGSHSGHLFRIAVSNRRRRGVAQKVSAKDPLSAAQHRLLMDEGVIPYRSGDYQLTWAQRRRINDIKSGKRRTRNKPAMTPKGLREYRRAMRDASMGSGVNQAA